jgi:adenine phosphoribosyltransferase
MTNALDLRSYVRDVPDFPQPGILFRDVTPLLQNGPALQQAVAELSDYVASKRPDAIVAIESRGFIFGAPIAARLGLPLVPVRKPGKLPAEVMSVEYALEYGSGQLDIHKDGLHAGDGVVIVDDLLATGGTAAGAARLVEMIGGRVLGTAFLIELTALGGRDLLKEYEIFALLAFA